MALAGAGMTTGRATRVDLQPLYAPLRERFAELDIEGAFVVGDEPRLLQRGIGGDPRNACIAFAWRVVVAAGEPAMRRAASLRRGVAALLAVAAGVVAAQNEVPFVVTPDQVTLAMLEIAGTGPSDHVIDLGSGDGRIVITAARRFGASGLGVEIVPELVARSRAAALAAGVAGRVEFREQDLFRTDLAPATVVTMYLLPDVNMQLRPRLAALKPGTRIVSHDWHLGDWQPDRTLTIDVPDKPVGRERVSRVHLWIVPARVDGVWCAGAGRLDIVQRFQRFSAVLETAGDPAPPKVFDGRIDALVLHPEPAAALSALRVSADGRQLREAGSPGADGRVFVRAPAGRCARSVP